MDLERRDLTYLERIATITMTGRPGGVLPGEMIVTGKRWTWVRKQEFDAMIRRWERRDYVRRISATWYAGNGQLYAIVTPIKGFPRRWPRVLALVVAGACAFLAGALMFWEWRYPVLLVALLLAGAYMLRKGLL
jgi:hypothetical protein